MKKQVKPKAVKKTAAKPKKSASTSYGRDIFWKQKVKNSSTHKGYTFYA